MEGNQFDQALPYLYEAESLIKEVATKEPRAIVGKATVYQLLAVCYLKQKNYAKADSLLRASLDMLGSKESNLRPYIFRTMADNSMELGRLDSAWHYLQLAEPYLASSQREELKINMYESYTNYYKAKGEPEKVVYYSDLLSETKEQKIQSSRKIANELIEKLSEERHSALRNMKLVWAIGAVIFILGLAIVYFLWKLRKAEIARFKSLLTEIETKNQEQQKILSHMQLDSFVGDNGVAADTEKRLLYDLVKLELDNFFLDTRISVPFLARELGTNTKYVTFLLRKYRKQDFNDYIQYQRIMYISNRLRIEPTLWDYKLSYLAEIAGFPTHSMFSVAFKNVTGITPSSFIDRLRQM